MSGRLLGYPQLIEKTAKIFVYGFHLSEQESAAKQPCRGPRSHNSGEIRITGAGSRRLLQTTSCWVAVSPFPTCEEASGESEQVGQAQCLRWHLPPSTTIYYHLSTFALCSSTTILSHAHQTRLWARGSADSLPRRAQDVIYNIEQRLRKCALRMRYGTLRGYGQMPSVLETSEALQEPLPRPHASQVEP